MESKVMNQIFGQYLGVSTPLNRINNYANTKLVLKMYELWSVYWHLYVRMDDKSFTILILYLNANVEITVIFLMISSFQRSRKIWCWCPKVGNYIFTGIEYLLLSALVIDFRDFRICSKLHLNILIHVLEN